MALVIVKVVDQGNRGFTNFWWRTMPGGPMAEPDWWWDASTALDSKVARRCGPSSKSILYPDAQLYDLLKPMVMAAQVKDDSEDKQATNQAKAEVIQQAVVDYLHCMLRQPASQLNIKHLDDLGLPQQDLDQMKACMTPRGCKRERVRQDSLTKARAQRKRTKATASKYKSTKYMVSDSEKGSPLRRAAAANADSGRDSPGPGNRGHRPSSPHDNDDNSNGDDHSGSSQGPISQDDDDDENVNNDKLQ
ncbi:uncharacterized protein P174DRAFT_433645 [Aspergillus novofumigatus IBT 16806]|uniref:Uncharacterized protein n=1 Tax=Aspergillus novofumigatus (strain IBT 16806) TaxID=1392255 RepID=A0A2I1BYR1_ASPN1|nr:uncharacterized protein P174DRAFT_433645 [Aspergillus novofumigatus IBT 16806]PKX90517.1 hypothetical protein P174DRAFT_433645 [Aspergillus novofumigatus IBT 16806]